MNREILWLMMVMIHTFLQGPSMQLGTYHIQFLLMTTFKKSKKFEYSRFQKCRLPQYTILFLYMWF